MKDKRHWLGICFTALVTASLLSGCAGSGSKELPAQSTATEPVTQDIAKVEGGIVVTAKIKAIDKKNKVVTLQFRNGKEGKVKCGPEVRNFAKMRVGEDVTTTLIETVELFVTGKEKPSAERTTEVDRAPLGSKPGFSVIDMVEMKAAVVAIDYQT
jgi:ribosomal protein S1